MSSFHLISKLKSQHAGKQKIQWFAFTLLSLLAKYKIASCCTGLVSNFHPRISNLKSQHAGKWKNQWFTFYSAEPCLLFLQSINIVNINYYILYIIYYIVNINYGIKQEVVGPASPCQISTSISKRGQVKEPVELVLKHICVWPSWLHDFDQVL